jgi:integrase/recombinase XerC
MTDDRALVVSNRSLQRDKRSGLRNKTVNVPAIRRGEEGAADYVSHLTPGDVKLLVLVASRGPRHGERNAALISLIFDGALRVSEALGVRPADIEQTPDGYTVAIMGKGSKPGKVAVTASTAQMLFALAYHHGTSPAFRLFPITRSQVFRIVQDAYRRAGVRQPSKATDRVGAVHVLRHSGALARLAASGNPKSVQNQLRHKSAQMTLRYMKTLSSDESLKIQEGVNPW